MRPHKQPSSPRRLPQGLILLYEDRDILVVDKPAGLLSIASGTERTKTAHWILSEYLRKRGEQRQAAVVHRLDRDTSGVMLFAKSGFIKGKLMETWEQSVQERRYAALAEGRFEESWGVIDAPLGEDPRGRVVVMPGGKGAITRWELLKAGTGYSLLSLALETGRRNQIRAHLSHLGHPVAGDWKYHAQTNPLNRLALHAEGLVFQHPRNGERLAFETPMPAAFRRACT
jgi:23S rRNA pseudouridine1911/1915/1917 synthase